MHYNTFVYIYIYHFYFLFLFFIYNLWNMSNFKGESPLDHTLVEVKHIREMIGKFCPNMKLTQYNWALGKD